MQKRDFDSEASQWDDNPVRRKMAQDVFSSLTSRIPLDTAMDVMDFGCGTGLLTVKISPLVRSVTAVDGSAGMLAVLRQKLAGEKIENVRTERIDPDNGDRLDGQYDLIVSTMTLHHIREIDRLLNDFHSVLKAGGVLCISDLDPEQGLFHPDATGVFHEGFDRRKLHEQFAAAGFTDISADTASVVSKPAGSDNALRDFTIFMMTGKKT